ncbi:MAG: biotin--[acetyl-CoA-carboxylase] ligase [Bacteriovoracaceae bacterium]
MIEHIHLQSCDSTQIEIQKRIKDLTSRDCNLLVSTSEQTNGHGRRGRGWLQPKSGLCFSFTITPPTIPTLLSLEIGVLISQFFEKTYQQSIKLKWPNDLLCVKAKKVGGIIIDHIDGKYIVGIGINLEEGPKELSDISSGLHLGDFHDQDYSKIPELIYHYCLSNRCQDIIQSWSGRCLHLNQEVLIEDDDTKIEGVFKGLGENGQALIQTPETLESFYSGTLRIKAAFEIETP